MERPLVLQVQGTTKLFPGMRALDDVTLEVREGDIHAIYGENGAGKSTLVKVLSGVYPHGSYEGRIVYIENEIVFKDVKESEEADITVIHQELTVIPELSITKNIFLGNETANHELIDWGVQRRRVVELLEGVELMIDPDTPIKHLGVNQQQLIEIARAFSKDVRLLILGEPAFTLNETNSANLLELMQGLRSRDITCIIISRKLNETAAIADAVAVIRDGHAVEMFYAEAGQIDEDRITRTMVGRPIESRFPTHESHPGEVIFGVSDWRVGNPNIPGRMICKNSSFFVRAGEIVGFVGLMGTEKTRLMRSIFGQNYDVHLGGSIKIRRKKTRVTSVVSATRQGIAYVPEGRKASGPDLLGSIHITTVSVNLRGILRGRLLDPGRESWVAEHYRDLLNVKTHSVNSGVTTSSGENQQEVVLGKRMFTEPDVLILDEPTRGTGVGVKYEIYRLIQHLVDQGKVVVTISSELSELLGISGGIYIAFEGSVTGMLNRQNADQERLVRMMTNTSKLESNTERTGILYEVS